MDQIDKRILHELQKNGKLQNNELAQLIGLSPSPCLRRVKQLEDEGVIEQYVALLNPQKVNLAMSVFARVWLKSQEAAVVDQFVEAIKEMPEVVECQLMAGDCDFFLRIVVADLDAYRKFQIHHLTQIPCIQSVKTEIPLQTVKSTTALPLV
ncbi:Lrp/AsnC family transcriptional regulator [Acinetobacter sp.]|jgi:Lrp/AsnC family leucine-responsive transcriptional regulator|uniref:Lrp/AsnC family transcriptional regulator n=1 Tax=Acinetobacter sp. TaxID=472 RepID=UPI0028A07328|nr:Lrp/AsnC family transcriptional regulator [Acinetobacter sp.]